MQNGQATFLTKDELRVAAMRQLNVSKNSFDFAWIDAVETAERHDWYEPLRQRRVPKPSRFPIRVLPAAPGNAEQCRLLGVKRKTYALSEVTAFDPLRKSATSNDISSDRTFTVFQLFSLVC